MQIKRLRNTHFGTKKISRVVTGWALYEPGKGWVAFSADRDEFGILIPYIPCGGKRALQSILDAGGFCSHGNDLSCRHDSRIALGNAVFYVHHRTEDLHFIPKT